MNTHAQIMNNAQLKLLYRALYPVRRRTTDGYKASAETAFAHKPQFLRRRTHQRAIPEDYHRLFHRRRTIIIGGGLSSSEEEDYHRLQHLETSYRLHHSVETTMVFNEYVKQRILFWYGQKKAPPIISRLLREEGIVASRRGIQKFLCRYEETETIARKKGSGSSSKVNDEVKKVVEDKMTLDDETTAEELKGELARQGVTLSKSTILRCRRSLGWTYRGSSYCQLIREANKAKRLEWALEYRDEAVGDGFQDVLWTDECTVQLEAHRRFCCRKKGEPPRNKPR